MTTPPVSVVIVSRHRPAELSKCLLALRFQTLDGFEVIIVGDKGIPDVLARLGLTDHVTFAELNLPNISAARNIGIGLACGDVIAFIDDDAIAEPTWLERLIEAFSDPNVAATGGFVRGRNGISYQWMAASVDPTGQPSPLDVHSTQTFKGSETQAIKTQGTNCAFRRSTLIALGGFDENLHFYLDETDLNIRLGRAGHYTAIVPNAEVQHGFAESARRTKNRAPKSLFDEGASQSYLLKKAGTSTTWLKTFEQGQHNRLTRLLISGDLEPRDFRNLMKTLRQGFEDGPSREPKIATFAPAPQTAPKFPTHESKTCQAIYGHWRSKHALFTKAKKRALSGISLTVFLYSYTALYHRRWFHEDGFWVQSGGLFGKSDRNDPIFRRYSMKQRTIREVEAIGNKRFFDSTSPERLRY